MPKFSYVVKDKHGKSIKNVADAISQAQLVQQLQQQNYFIVSIREISQVTSGVAAGQKTQKKKKRKFKRKKVKLDDMVTFSRQLATMLEAGVPLLRSLSVIQTQIESKQFFEIMQKVHRDVEQGTNLSLSLAAYPKVFNQFWVSLIEVGEASGTLPTILNKLAFYLEQQAAFRSTVISGIIYPAILFGVSVGAIGFFALVVGPKFQDIFSSMGVELPLLTRVLLNIFTLIKKNILLIIGGTVLAFFTFKTYIKTYQGRLLWENFLFRAPVVGPIMKDIIVERFAAQMSILIDSGVPILQALDITERLVDNNTCALIVSKIKESVKGGELLVGPMERSGFFPPLCIQMIMVGEETGELSKMLKHVSKFYQEAVETFMKRFATIIEPFMLVFMGAVIGVIVVAMFLPMFNISQLG